MKQIFVLTLPSRASIILTVHKISSQSRSRIVHHMLAIERTKFMRNLVALQNSHDMKITSALV